MGFVSSAGTALVRVGAWLGGGFGGAGRAYEAGRLDTPELSSWTPGISETNDEVNMNRDQIVARARDLYRNNPTIRAAVDRLVETVIGSMPWLEATPDWEALGKDFDWAYTWSTGVEARFRVYANDHRRFVDVDRKATWGELLRVGYIHRLIDGETCFLRVMKKDRGAYQTCWKIIDPDRLTNPMGMADWTILPNGNAMISGCEVNAAGVTVAYHIRKAHPARMSGTNEHFTWVRVPRWTVTGTEQFIHSFRQERADQRRGMSRFAAAMVRIKQADRYSRAELDAAIANALNVAFIESPAPTNEIRDMLAPSGDETTMDYATGLMSFRAKNKLRMDELRFVHGMPGEKMNWTPPVRPAEAYPAFDAAQSRKIAGVAGLSYPHMTNDWADINYSSGRLMRNEMWRGITDDRNSYTQETAGKMYAAWLEEDVMLGNTKVPGGAFNFYKHAGALCMCEIMGPGPGYGDPKKEEEANEKALRMGTTTMARICGEQGRDYRRELTQAAHEVRLMKSLGLTHITDQEPLSKVGRPSDGATTGEGDGGDGRDGDGKFAPKKVKEPAK